VLSSFCYAGGVWFTVRQGAQGVLVTDERGLSRVYLLTKPRSHYHRVMTGQDRMPVLFEEGIKPGTQIAGH
jgi:hypothetical protein